MGIKDAPPDVLAPRYIYTGLLCLNLPVAAGIILIAAFVLWGERKDVFRPSILLLFVLIVSLNVLITFTNPGFFEGHQL